MKSRLCFLYLFCFILNSFNPLPKFLSMAKESEPKASKHKHFKLSKRRVEKNGMKELKRLKAILEGLPEQQTKLKGKLNIPGEAKQAMDQIRQVNYRATRFDAWIQTYIETKLADPSWDAANKGN